MYMKDKDEIFDSDGIGFIDQGWCSAHCVRARPTNVALLWFWPGAVSELSLLLVLVLFQGFFSRFSGFSPFHKTIISKLKFNQVHNLHETS